MELLESNEEFCVVVKPVGMDSETEVPQALSEQLGGTFYSVHRLDKNVGGVMVYARTPRAAAALSALGREGKLQKEYIACVHGTPPERGEYVDLLWKDSRQNKVYVVKRMRAGVREARLSFCRLTAGETSLVRVKLQTGRSHQIRVQFASRGFPLAGDHKYGARDKEPAPRLFSCALSFPWNGEQKKYQAQPDWAMDAVQLHN